MALALLLQRGRRPPCFHRVIINARRNHSACSPIIMGPPPFSIVGQDDDEDRISALPDHLLVAILERLDLPTAVRAGAVSTRWRHLPHQLSRIRLKACQFHGTTVRQIMRAYTSAVWSLLSLFPPPACRHGNGDGDCSRAIKTIRLGFYVSDPQMSSIGRAVEGVVSRGETGSLKFRIYPPSSAPPLFHQTGQRFMSFARAYPAAFRWLTTLTLKNLAFGDSDVADLVRACHKLRRLSLRHCRLADHRHSALKIDAPCSGLLKLRLKGFRCARVELISVPRLRKVRCDSWRRENPPVIFGDVPELREVSLASRAKAWQAPFALSDCLSRSAAGNLSKLYLNFRWQMIWIKPEHSKQLSAIFSNLTDVRLFGIFPECDLNWTLFILEAAPSLQSFTVSRTRHSCLKTSHDSDEKTNVIWEPSKDFKHFNLKLLVMKGFEEEDDVANYIGLVMKRAMGLRRIKLRGKTCKGCNAIDHESARSLADEASMHRVSDRLANTSSPSVEIIIC